MKIDQIRKQLERASETISKLVTADDFSLNIGFSDSLQCRFAQNAITQHKNGSNFNVNLKVAFDNKTGTANINQLDEDSLKYLVENAEHIAKLNQPDPEYIKTVEKAELPKIDSLDQQTADMSSEDLVEIVKKSVLNAESIDANVSGMTERDIELNYLITKNGFSGYDAYTGFSHSMTIKKDDAETKVSKSVKSFKDFSIKSEISLLNSQLNSLHKPESFNACQIPVILRPAAVMSFFQFLFWMMNLRDADEGTSSFTGQMGKEFFGKNFSLKSTMDLSELYSPRFSNEGIVTRNYDWIDKGVIRNMPASRYYALQKGIEPAFPYNFYIPGEDASEEDMMSKVERGLIVNRLWYIRFVDRKRGELTGLTRDGVMYFENGKIVKSVNNLRWNEILHEASTRILALGPSLLQETYVKVPSMLIDNFNFVDSTTF